MHGAVKEAAAPRHGKLRGFIGIGMVIIASAQEAEKIKAQLAEAGEAYYEIGKVVRGGHDVTIKGCVFNE